MYVYLPLGPQSLMADDLRYEGETQSDKIEVPHGNLQRFDKSCHLLGACISGKYIRGGISNSLSPILRIKRRTEILPANRNPTLETEGRADAITS